MKKIIAEAIGTFFLTLTICFTTLQSPLLAPFAIAWVLMVGVYVLGPISWAHFNPAVSLALTLQKKIDRLTFGKFLAAQCGWALLASLIRFGYHGSTLALSGQSGASFLWIALIEILFTALLAFTVLHVAASKSTEGNNYFGVAIGAALLVGILAGWPISWAVFNPAVAVGTGITNHFDGSINLVNTFVYIVSPAIGGVLAARLYSNTK